MEVELAERVVQRREALQQYCRVDPVKNHLRLHSYYQLAQQLYRQSEVYYRERSWDHAYVHHAKCKKKGLWLI